MTQHCSHRKIEVSAHLITRVWKGRKYIVFFFLVKTQNSSILILIVRHLRCKKNVNYLRIRDLTNLNGSVGNIIYRHNIHENSGQWLSVVIGTFSLPYSIKMVIYPLKQKYFLLFVLPHITLQKKCTVTDLSKSYRLSISK